MTERVEGIASQLNVLEARVAVLEANSPEESRAACATLAEQVAKQWGDAGSTGVVKAIITAIRGGR